MNPSSTKTKALEDEDVLPIHVRAIPANMPLPVEFFLFLGDRYLLFRPSGDHLTANRLKRLANDRVKSLYIKRADGRRFREFLWDCFCNEQEPAELRTSAFKEALTMQMREFDQADDLTSVVTETTALFKASEGTALFSQVPLVHYLREETSGTTALTHSVNVAIYSLALARQISPGDKESIWKAGLGGLIHDIGETRVQVDGRKEDLISRSYWEENKKHPSYGVELLSKISGVAPEILDIVQHHHENFDGTGYPKTLKGEEIGRLARIVSICDVFDTLTAMDSLKRMSPPEAVSLMHSMQPGRFDPELFEIFIAGLNAK